MFGEDESESPRVPSPWESIIELSRIGTPVEGRGPSPLTNEMDTYCHSLNSPASILPSLPPENDNGSIEYKLRLIHPSPARFTRLVTQLKWRLLEGGGRALYELGVGDDGELVGLGRKDMEETVDVLSKMAGELGARVWVVREIRVGRGAGGTRFVADEPFISNHLALLDNSEAMPPSVLGNMHIYDIFKPRPVMTRAQTEIGVSMHPNNSTSSIFPTSTLDQLDNAIGGFGSGAKHYHKSKKERKQKGKKYHLNYEPPGGPRFTSASNVDENVDAQHAGTQQKPNGPNGVYLRTQPHNRIHPQAHRGRNTQSVSNYSSHSNSYTQSHLSLNPNLLPIRTADADANSSHRHYANGSVVPHLAHADLGSNGIRGGRANRREVRDRRRAEKAKGGKEKKALAIITTPENLVPGSSGAPHSAGNSISGVAALYVDAGNDISPSVDTCIKSEITGGVEVVNRVEIDVEHLRNDDDDTGTTCAQMKANVGMKAERNTNQPNSKEGPHIRTNGCHSQKNRFDNALDVRPRDRERNGFRGKGNSGDQDDIVTPQLHIDKPRANRRVHYNVWNASKAFEAVAETKEDEKEDNREGDDKDEPRLIIEALVIRNFEIGEAFLDFGGFGGLEAIEDLGGVNGGSFSG
ncbi:uncharacterized protein C8R40DRAFT_1073762 [Lentinula edodes]|uniref:uncharacterized protein n=1 Tax=Lentinula edodes TaxID=5353 RepID=UPI001E8D471C|nr:uncharacterized protein C8R40DRAFT_1073762 [Lentinula edodes]KAH7869796.1 hypothetical protein C8R40DRAFT_1073762 [Lentinula edodes]